MIYKVFTVFDSAAEDYCKPFFDVSRGAALRSFADISQDTSSAIGKHPQDFTLFELGDYDSSNASFIPHVTPISLGVALEFCSDRSNS